MDSFTTVDLFFKYDLAGSAGLKDLAFTLGVQNLFDQNPPLLRSLSGFTNGGTVGRVVQFGIEAQIF